MRLLLLLLTFAPMVLAQVNEEAGSRSAINLKQNTVRRSGANALKSEEVRSKAGLCAESKNSGQATLGICLVAEGRTTERNYLEFTRSIRAMLRPLTSIDTPRNSPMTRLPFDAAEATWRLYRDQTCTSMATQWQGGDEAPVAEANCRLTVTWSHMQELAGLYADLWH